MNLAIGALGRFSSAMRVFFLSPLLALAALPALAQSDTSFFTDTTLSGPQRYNLCLALAQKDPQTAYEKSSAWRARGGMMYAAHCEAVSLVNLKRYAEAARKLTTLANGGVDASMRVQLYIQAANAWMLAEQPGEALPLLSDALEISPDNMDALTDRARARAMHRDWPGAESDLTEALGKDPTRPDLYVLRSSARHAMGKKEEARADIDRALEMVARLCRSIGRTRRHEARSRRSRGRRGRLGRCVEEIAHRRCRGCRTRPSRKR